jgi:flagella basal body P-ring formation protein FlgA
MSVGKWRGGAPVGSLLAGVLFLAGAMPGAAGPPEGRVVVRAAASVDGEAIRLGDIASLAGTAAELARLDIQPAPKPGTTLSVAGAAILERLRAHGVDLGRMRYVIPPLVRVRRRAQEVPAAAIRALVEEHVGRQLDALGGRALLRSVEVPGPVQLAPGPYGTRVEAGRRGPPTGRARVTVDFVQNDAVVETVTATAHVEVFEEVYVARRAIPRGTILGPDDLLAERRAAAALPRGAVLRAADAIGMEAKVPISALTPLRHDQLGAPVLVRRGDIVTLVAESGPLRITTKGEVREDGPREGQVRVWNLGSRREVVGRVVDGKTVVVSF